MSIISLLLHKSKAKLRMSVNNNDIIPTFACFPKDCSNQYLFCRITSNEWLLVVITSQSFLCTIDFIIL